MFWIIQLKILGITRIPRIVLLFGKAPCPVVLVFLVFFVLFHRWIYPHRAFRNLFGDIGGELFYPTEAGGLDSVIHDNPLGGRLVRVRKQANPIAYRVVLQSKMGTNQGEKGFLLHGFLHTQGFRK
jgi:hypothetical protein